MDDDLGTLTPAGGGWALTFTRHLDHPPDTVWRAVSEDEHLAAWFPQRIEGERRAGAPLRFVTEGGESFDGEMVAFDPPRRLELRWGGDLVRIELEPEGTGTRLTLTDTFGELGRAARDAAGWHECLDRLVADLDSTAPSPWSERWLAVHPRYVAAFGPEASSIGPPEGWEAAARHR